MPLFKNPEDIVLREICAPVSGEALPISQVPDPVFSEGILGAGVAIFPTEGQYRAPADGEITMLFPTCHAFSMTTDQGADLLVHIGLDTASLQGTHFTAHGQVGQRVKKGDLIVEVDLEAVKAAGKNLLSPLLVCNSDEFKEVYLHTGPVSAGEGILWLE